MMHTVKTSTALRVWRWFTQAIGLAMAMHYAAGTYSVGFLSTMAIALIVIWWFGRTVIKAYSRNGILEVNKIL